MNTLKRMLASVAFILMAALGLTTVVVPIVASAPAASASENVQSVPADKTLKKHTPDVKAKTVCISETQKQTTFTLTYTNVPAGVTVTKVETHTDDDLVFNGNWTYNTFLGQWTERVIQTPMVWSTAPFPASMTGNGPWEYAHTTFSNGVTVKSDTRAEDLEDLDCNVDNPPSGTATFTNTYCDALAPVGNSGNVDLNNDGTTVHGDLWNGTIWVSIGNVLEGIFGDSLIDDFGYPAKIRLVFTGEDGTSLPPFEHTFPSAPKDAADCLTVIPTPPKPPVDDSDCVSDGVRPDPGPNGAYLEPDTGPGVYTLVYTAPAGETYITGKTVTYTIHVPAKKPSPSADCPITVTVVDPDSKQQVCLATDKPSKPSFTLASIAGVAYYQVVNGVETAIAAGLHYVLPGTSVTIIAKPTSSIYVLSNPGWTWTAEFPAKSCGETLALTGDEILFIGGTIGGGLLYVGICWLWVLHSRNKVRAGREGYDDKGIKLAH